MNIPIPTTTANAAPGNSGAEGERNRLPLPSPPSPNGTNGTPCRHRWCICVQCKCGESCDCGDVCDCAASALLSALDVHTTDYVVLEEGGQTSSGKSATCCGARRRRRRTVDTLAMDGAAPSDVEEEKEEVGKERHIQQRASGKSGKVKTASDRNGPKCAVLSLSGMSCQSCVNAVTNAIRAALVDARRGARLPSPEEGEDVSVHVSLKHGRAHVAVMSADEARLARSAVEEAGFAAWFVALEEYHHDHDTSSETAAAKTAVTVTAEDEPVEQLEPGGEEEAAAEGKPTRVESSQEEEVEKNREGGGDGSSSNTGGEEKQHETVDNTSENNGLAPRSSSTSIIAPPPPPPVAIRRIAFGVSGMTCAMCTRAITAALTSMNGVQTARVNLATEYAVVEYDESTVGRGADGVTKIIACVEDAGYDVDRDTGDLPAALLDKDEESQHVTLSGKDRAEELARRQARDVRRKRSSFLLSLLGTVPILLITMVFGYVPSDALHDFLKQQIVPGLTLEALLLWIFATPVQFGSGSAFYRGAYKGVRNGALGMDMLVSIGTTAAYVYAAVQICMGIQRRDVALSMGAHFFETSAVLISFVLLGKWLQLRAVRRTSFALTRLMSLQSKTALLVKPGPPNDGGGECTATTTATTTGGRGGEAVTAAAFNPQRDSYVEEEVPTDRVHRNDVIKVIRGASIPADGKVCHGEVTVDEAMITGESMPVLKTVDADVLGGTVCVEGVAYVRVTGVGSDTALSQIVRLVEDAQMNQAPVQEFADKVSSVFVPTVCLLSLLTFVVWYTLAVTGVVPESWHEGTSNGSFAMMFALATLVISCPCALGLATPTAVIVGTGVGAANGILIKGGEQLQMASKIKSVIFDKTGTLTRGKPCITNFVRMKDVPPSLIDLDDDDLLWMLGSLERNSEHPLADAVVKYAEQVIPAGSLRDKPFAEPSEFMAVTGKGVSCSVNNTPVAVGSRSFFATKGIDVTEEAEETLVEFEGEGKTAILAAINGSVAAVVGISDEIKPDSAAALQHLQKKNVEVWLVTGDNRRTAAAVSKQLGLPMEYVIAEALPAAKLRKVKELQAEGKVVAMVGDGINDSPALAQADVGISVGTGAEIAAEAADIVLVKCDVSVVCVAIDLARTIFNRIRMNLFWALVYNCLGIPIAMGVLYPVMRVTLPPTVAALAMVLSSLSVVASSLLLKLYKPPEIA